MPKKDEKLIAEETDPVMKKYEEEALAEQKALEAKGYSAEEMPARFSTGGATYDEKAAWIAEHGGAPDTAVIEPGYAAPKDVAPD
jgi:hypothetical protein